jgi:hypothetical protein
VSIKRPADRTFGLVFAALFGLVALVGWLLSGRILLWAIALAGALLVPALFVPGILMPLNRLWTRLGQRIAIVINHLLLGSFFYLVILPFGLVARGLRWISMPKRPDLETDSYWKPVQRQATAETYPDLF